MYPCRSNNRQKPAPWDETLTFNELQTTSNLTSVGWMEQLSSETVIVKLNTALKDLCADETGVSNIFSSFVPFFFLSHKMQAGPIPPHSSVFRNL